MSPRRVLAAFGAAVLLLAAASCAPPEPEEVREGRALAPLGTGLFEEVRSFGANPGGLKMYRYEPDGIGAAAPLVVALHGCTQNATAYRAAGWEELADQYGFHVIYPEQQSGNNMAYCFNWAGDYGDFSMLERGRDENGSIAAMVQWMISEQGADPTRVFVTGHSAGAAMSLVMLSTWPDLFAAGASIAGVPFRCPNSYADVFTCMSPGVDRTPAEWADRAHRGDPGFGGTHPRLSVWHGTSDYTVGVANLRETVDQWTALHGADAEPDAEVEVSGQTRRDYRDGSGVVVVEAWEIQGAGHATFVDPDSGCGSLGAFFEDHDVCAALETARFFGLVEGGDEGGGDGDVDADADTDADSDTDGDTDSDGEPCTCGGCAVEPGPAAPGSVLGLALLAATGLLAWRRRRAG